MSNFLKDIIKETGNEYAGLVSDGVDSADVTSFIDTDHIHLMLYYQAVYMVVCQVIK